MLLTFQEDADLTRVLSLRREVQETYIPLKDNSPLLQSNLRELEMFGQRMVNAARGLREKLED